MKKFIENNVKCDLYIGEKAGKRILNVIEKAEKSVKVISPFLNEKMIDRLLAAKNRGVDIKLISTDNVAGLSENTPDIKQLRKLVKQKRYLDKEEANKRSRFLKIFIVCVFILITYFGLGFYLLLENTVDIFASSVEISVIYIFALIYMYVRYKNWKIYNYKYYLELDARFACSPGNTSQKEKTKFDDIKFYHTKLYIIDGEIAFLGSLNFTTSGMYYNHESCVSIKDRDTVNRLIDFYSRLFTDIRVINLEKIVRRFYREKIN